MIKIDYKNLSPLSLNDFQYQVKSGYKDTFIVFIHKEDEYPKVNCVTISTDSFGHYLLYKKADTRIPTVVLKPIKSK